MLSEHIVGTTVTIKGNRFTLAPKGGKSFEAILRLSPRKKPRQIDLIVKGQAPTDGVYLGIYALDGDTLQICYCYKNSQRPTDFATKDNGAAYWWTMKRKKE